MNEPKAAQVFYTDGHPLDQIHYREYKILLHPERFTTADQFEEYWDVVKHIAKKLGVEVTTNKHAFHRLVREVLFYDTPDFDLYNNSFILRKRTFYEDGWPKDDHELTLKYRHIDRDATAAVDVHPLLEGESNIKFKDEVLPLKDEIGGIRSLYSHNCVLISPNIILEQGIEDIEKVFPALKNIELARPSPMALVNNMSVEEVQVDVGSFNFGHHYEAKATIAIWRNRASEQSLVGEFAFQAKFDKLDEVHHKAKELSEEFFKAVQTHAPDWVLLGTTKTAKVYGHGKKPTKNSE